MYKTSSLVKNVSELTILLDNDFDNFKDVLDQIIADVLKNRRHVDTFVSYVNGQLANSNSRKKGLILLNNLLPLCGDDYLQEHAVAWLNNSLKYCKFETSLNIDAYKVIGPLLTFCHDTPELNKSITSGILTKILENITKIDYNKEEAYAALKCLETCLIIYPGSCVPFKTSIENFLLAFVDCKTNKVIRLAGKCLHAFQQIGGGGNQGINHKQSWKKQQNLLCLTIHSIMDEIFVNVMEMNYNPPEIVSILNLPKLPNGDAIKVNSNRLINLIIFAQEMLLGAFPTPKIVSPSEILHIISRGLAVNANTLGDNILNNSLQLYSNLYFIHKNLLELLQALIICLGCNLIPYAAMISKIVTNNLKVTKPKNADNIQAFCELRLKTYQTLSMWLITAKSSSNIQTNSDSIVATIINDITPVTTEINLTIQTTSKHMSKKARKKSQQEKITQSSVAKTYSPINKKSEILENVYQNKICLASLETLQKVLIYAGQFLKPILHKQLQELVIKLLFKIQQGFILPPYEDANCKIALYNTLTNLVTNHHYNIPPPIEYAVHILSKGQTDSDLRISSCCSIALTNLNSFIHPSCVTLQLPLDIENLKIELEISEKENRERDELNNKNEDSNKLDMEEEVVESNNANSIEKEIEEKVEKLIIENEDSNGKEINLDSDSSFAEDSKINQLSDNKIFENGTNEKVEISDDEQSVEMEKLIITDEEIGPTTSASTFANNNNKKTEFEEAILDMEEEDMLTSFVDVVNE